MYVCIHERVRNIILELLYFHNFGDIGFSA